MERVGDYCENFAEFAETLAQIESDFTRAAKEQLKSMMEVCVKSYDLALEAFINKDRSCAFKVIEEESRADDLEITMRAGHMERLVNNECSTQAGVVFLDALVCMERVSDHSRNIAEEILQQTS